MPANYRRQPRSPALPFGLLLAGLVASLMPWGYAEELVTETMPFPISVVEVGEGDVRLVRVDYGRADGLVRGRSGGALRQ